MKAFIDPPRLIPFYLRIGIWISRKVTGRDLLPGKLLAWYPKVAISAGIMEAMGVPPAGFSDHCELKPPVLS